MFHFNKAHLSDPTIPMWVFKVDGKTYYVNHAIFENVTFATKETPLNPHTKGSIKIKGLFETTEEEGQTIGWVRQPRPALVPA